MSTWIFWRHAEAGFASNDLARPLTERGWRQAEDSALWLREQGFALPVYCSQALRGQQTAIAYAAPQAQLAGLNPDGPLHAVWQALARLDGEDAIIVGHMPWISEVVATLSAAPRQAVGYSGVHVLHGAGEQWRQIASYRDD